MSCIWLSLLKLRLAIWVQRLWIRPLGSRWGAREPWEVQGVRAHPLSLGHACHCKPFIRISISDTILIHLSPRWPSIHVHCLSVHSTFQPEFLVKFWLSFNHIWMVSHEDISSVLVYEVRLFHVCRTPICAADSHESMSTWPQNVCHEMWLPWLTLLLLMSSPECWSLKL